MQDVTAFEVLGLYNDRKYRFRIIVVYENNDSKIGPLSKKFKLNAKDFTLSPKPKPPSVTPIITGILPLSPTSLRVGWMVLGSSKDIIEGYFIYVKPSMSDEKLKKITILGATTHSHIIEALIPGTKYEIKISAFNLSGASPSSNSTTKFTLPLPPIPSTEDFIEETSETVLSSEEDEVNENDKIVKYLILGGCLASSLILFVLLCYCIQFCQRKKKEAFQKTCDVHNITDKYKDTAREISNHQSFTNLDNRIARSNQSFLFNSTKEMLNRGSSSHFEMTLIPDGRESRHGNKNYSVSDSMFSSGHNSHSADLNSIGEYCDEPNAGWRRSRRSHEFNEVF